MPEVNYAYNEDQDTLVDEPIAPVASIEPKEETPKVEPAPREEPKVEPVIEKVEPKIDPVEKVEKPAEVPATDWRKSLKEVLKDTDKYEAFKELGLTDFEIGMLKYKEKTGDYTPYLEVKSVDYAKMTPEQLIKADMQKKYPGMNERALNFKYNKDLEEKYYLNRDDFPEDSDEAIYGQEQLRIDAEQKRKQFIEEQQQFKAPEPQPDLDATNREADLQRQRASLGESVMNNPFTKSLQANKYITFGEGEESFNYPVEDVQSLVDTALSAIVNSGYTDASKLNAEVFYKQLAYGKDPAKFEKELINHGRNLSKKDLQNELQNVTPPNNQTAAAPAEQKDYGYRG